MKVLIGDIVNGGKKYYKLNRTDQNNVGDMISISKSFASISLLPLLVHYLNFNDI